MRILHTVEFYAPFVGGAQEVVKQISERLVAQGHEVTVATATLSARTFSELNGVAIKEFEVAGNLVRGMTGDVDGYRRFLIDGGFDIVMNYAAQQWATDAALDVLPQVSARKVLVPCGFSALRLPEYSNYFRRMPDWLRGYDATVFMAEHYRDADFARQHQLSNMHLIPNGAAAEEFLTGDASDIRSRLGIADDVFLVLHVGSHSGTKGHAEAIRMFMRTRIPNAVLVIVGNDFVRGCGLACRAKAAICSWRPVARMSGKQVLVLDLPRADTVALFHAADLFLFPSNIECSPIVLFEAAASRTPFLASDAGNSREIARWTGAGEIIETREDRKGLRRPSVTEGCRRLERLWADPDRRREMANAGRAAWEHGFTWGTITRSYEMLYRNLLAQS